MNTVLFDLFGTLIEKKHYDYQNALRWLADTYFSGQFDELQALSLRFKNEYMELRKNGNRETSFFRQLELFETELNCKIGEDYASVELQFMRRFRDEKLAEGVSELLEFLARKDYSVYVLSNSIFSGDGLKAYLGDFGIEEYIKKVYSSADIGFRKPSRKSFGYVLEDAGISSAKDVYYVGDSLEKDFVGAENSGLTPILIGSLLDRPGLVFSDMYSLLEFFK